MLLNIPFILFQFTPRSQSHSRTQSRQSTPLGSDGDVTHDEGNIYMTSARVTTDEYPTRASANHTSEAFIPSSIFTTPRVNCDLFTDAHGFSRATPSDTYVDKNGITRAVPDEQNYSYTAGGGGTTNYRRHGRTYMGESLKIAKQTTRYLLTPPGRC